MAIKVISATSDIAIGRSDRGDSAGGATGVFLTLWRSWFLVWFRQLVTEVVKSLKVRRKFFENIYIPIADAVSTWMHQPAGSKCTKANRMPLLEDAAFRQFSASGSPIIYETLTFRNVLLLGKLRHCLTLGSPSRLDGEVGPARRRTFAFRVVTVCPGDWQRSSLRLQWTTRSKYKFCLNNGGAVILTRQQPT